MMISPPSPVIVPPSDVERGDHQQDYRTAFSDFDRVASGRDAPRAAGNGARPFHAVPGREIAGVGKVHKFYSRAAPAMRPNLKGVADVPVGIRILRPDPGREEHVRGERLHVARRNVDQQPALDLPIDDRFEVVTDGLNMPITPGSLSARYGPKTR